MTNSTHTSWRAKLTIWKVKIKEKLGIADVGYEHTWHTGSMSCRIGDIKDGGNRIMICGFGISIPRADKGDRVLLVGDGKPTRYKITDISYPSDPGDMFIAHLTFWPREILK